MTSSAPPVWAVGDDADPPTARTGSPEVEPEVERDAFDLDDHDDDHLVRFRTSWWTRALSEDPLTGSIAERRRIRPAIAAAVTGDPGPDQLAALDALQAALGQACDIPGLALSSREWTEVVAASDRCAS
ncbi:hypothetical protein [Quadrisphaera setariae]|uniref:Uncharacterized protein n=1 Tax=Quadrisphaera setariae TaxID=2593304 RepID=A0A5C8Z425_9ACTN|nr:hypothetical protein [Quadrisphaera setariae]TXR51690.1 hypothetical protein FMM08_21960 [Quadrisphaera setariae]